MRWRSVAVGLGVATLLLVLPTAAHSYGISSAAGRWPFDTITYYLPKDKTATPLERAMRSWNRGRVGWTFKRVRSRSQADVVFRVFLTRRRKECRGASVTGFRFGQAQIFIYGRCHDEGLLTLGAAHEVGHLLGLREERRRCAVMNPNFRGLGRAARPVGCRRGPAYWRDPVRADDRRGARAMSRRRAGLPRPLCDPPDEQPTAAQDRLCKYGYRCSGLPGVHGDALDRAKSYIASQCHRLLRVVPVAPGADPPPRGTGIVTGSFAGSTSNGQPVRFSVRNGRVRGFRITVRFTCSDGSTQFERPPTPGTNEPPNVEDLGPFPNFMTSDGRFHRSFEAPNETALYHLAGSLSGETWTGSIRVVEGFSHDNGSADPDGAVVCDTGTVPFSAKRL